MLWTHAASLFAYYQKNTPIASLTLHHVELGSTDIQAGTFHLIYGTYRFCHHNTTG
jgi:hypothetical protein